MNEWVVQTFIEWHWLTMSENWSLQNWERSADAWDDMKPQSLEHCIERLKNSPRNEAYFHHGKRIKEEHYRIVNVHTNEKIPWDALQ